MDTSDRLSQNVEPVRQPVSGSPRTSEWQYGSCLVVGASRGIGLALVDELLADTLVKCVIATYRSSNPSAGLKKLSERHPERLKLVTLDVSNDVSLRELECFLQQQPDGIDLAIHAAGILHEDEVQPEKSLEQCNPRSLMRLFEVNSIGPLMVARALLPLQPRQKRFTFAALSAMVGSIGDNRLGGWYGYRASKTALNQFVRTLSNECRVRHPSAAVVAIHPGTTDTKLSRPFQRNIASGKLYRPEQTAQRILKVLRGLNADHSGQFYNWDGSVIPW